MENKFTDYKLLQSEEIQNAYEQIKLHFSFQILSEKEKDWLKAIPLVYQDFPYTNYSASAYKEERLIAYNLAFTYTKRFSRTLIHEIAHIICYEYFSEKMAHTLEFAIVNYCLLYKYIPEETEFFSSYDIHDDECYRYISICPAQFDDFIKSLKWDTLEELTKRAKFLAMKIRAKQAFFTVTAWEKEYEQYKQITGTA